MKITLWIITTVLVILSFSKNKKKTQMALRKAAFKLGNFLPIFLVLMSGFALIITFIPAELIQKYIGTESGIRGIATAIGLGSISVMPGFAAFPLCAALKGQGIPYYIIAAFSLSLMNVGIVTFPLEKKFLGLKVAVIRNILAILVCIITVIVVKLVFGE